MRPPWAFAAPSLDAAGLEVPLRRAMARRMLSRGVMLKAESFLLLRSSIDTAVFARVFEQVVQYFRRAAVICR